MRWKIGNTYCMEKLNILNAKGTKGRRTNNKQVDTQLWLLLHCMVIKFNKKFNRELVLNGETVLQGISDIKKNLSNFIDRVSILCKIIIHKSGKEQMQQKYLLSYPVISMLEVKNILYASLAGV